MNINNKLKVIGFSAKARNGKDASCTILKRKLEEQGKKVLIVAYANYLKYLVATYFGGTYKRTPENRTLWQREGTDKVRTREPDYWVNTVIDFAKVFGEDYDYFLLSDCRFPNEYKRWNKTDFDITSVRVERLGFENDLTPEQRSHPSETSLDNYNFDYYIRVENGLDKLEIEIDKFIEWMKEMDNE